MESGTLNGNIETSAAGRLCEPLTQDVVIRSTNDHFVTVDGIVSEMHNPLAGRLAFGHRGKHQLESRIGNLRSEHGQQKTLSVHILFRLHHTDVHVDSGSRHPRSINGNGEGLGAYRGSGGHFHTQHEVAANRDLRNIRDVDITARDCAKGTEKSGSESGSVNPRNGNQIR